MERTGISRRGALTSAASVGVALPVLAACGGDEPDAASDPTSPSGSSSAPQTTEPTAPNTDKTDEIKEPAPDDGGGGIASAADVPVGGGMILAKQELVITQPTKGEFKGFTAICTHAGCTVTSVTDTINCPCHGSQFSIDDGSVVGGPAPSALPAKDVVVDGDAINLA